MIWITPAINSASVMPPVVAGAPAPGAATGPKATIPAVTSRLTSASTSASPSARELADLVDQIHATGAKAILLETGANPQLASQIAEETGIRVVSNIYTHSLTTSDGPAPSYLEMMRYNTSAIVAALQGN